MKNTIQNTETNTPKYCFSYIRFSSEGQRNGSSVDRQSPIAAKVAADKGWILKPEWNASDLGVSAFKGDNLKTIESIIDAVKVGKIPQGSVMVIEAFDRFSRADVDTAEDLLKKALKAGLEIYVDRGSHHLTRESINKPIDRIVVLLEFVAANESSAKLSTRVSKAWENRQKEMQSGEVALKTKEGAARKDMPLWLKNNGTSFEPNEKAETVASILTQYLDGIGATAIARKFNSPSDKIPTLTGEGEWSPSFIYRLLSDRRLIGENTFKGQRFSNYYPAIVSEEIFARVQSKLNDNRGKAVTAKYDDNKGANQEIRNLFSGVAVCTCGTKVKVTNGNAGQYVTCYGRIKGTCNEPSVKYSNLESSFARIFQLNPNQLLQNEESPNAALQILRGTKAETEKQIANITSFILKGICSDSMAKTQVELESQLKDINAKIELESAKTVAITGSEYRLAEIQANLENLTKDQTVRAQVQGWIRENVNQVTVNRSAKEFNVDLKNGRNIQMGLDGMVKGMKSVEALFSLSTLPVQIAAVQ